MDHPRVVELFEKRHFRCDCPTLSNDLSSSCSLFSPQDILPINDQNKYNHNFSGTFCSCQKSYELQENSENDTMLQCFICQDWFHQLCIKLENMQNFDNLSDTENVYVCSNCIKTLPFLKYYKHLQPFFHEEQPENQILRCPVKFHDSGSETIHESTFFTNDWLDKLCKCDDCIKLYKENDCLFLFPNSDSNEIVDIEAVQNNLNHQSNSKKRPLDFDLFNSSLNAFDQINDHQIKSTLNAAYNDYALKLENFFKQAHLENRIINSDDINEFFENLKKERNK